jgi:prepilin-type N-terminal cleavage/methylation domain-containing protein
VTVRRLRSGFTLVELTIALSLAGVVTAGMLMVYDSTNRAYQSTALATELDAGARRTLDRIGELLLASRRGSVVPAPPGAEAPFSTSQVDFQAATAFAGGAVLWGNTQRIEFQYSPSDPDDGIDNDNNGVVDDGRVVWTTNLGLPGQRSVVLSNWVSEYFAGETPDGTDENGNGLIDERGLAFDFQGERVTIRLTLERVVNGGRRLTQTIQRTIAFRNTGP